jgi:hypothetical protein
MTRSGQLGRWDPLRHLDTLATLWTTAAALPKSSSAAVAHHTLSRTVRRLIVGRRLTVRLDGHDLTVTITHFHSRLDLRRLAIGQLNDVRIVARGIEWNGHRVDHASVVLRNVQLRPGSAPVLVTGPVDLVLELPAAALENLFRSATPRLAGGVGPDGIVRLHWARRPAIGNLEVDARLDGSTLRLRPAALALRRQRWRLPARLPAHRVQLPDLPLGLVLTGVSFGPNLLRLTGTLPAWRVVVPRTLLEDVIVQLTSVGRP